MCDVRDKKLLNFFADSFGAVSEALAELREHVDPRKRAIPERLARREGSYSGPLNPVPPQCHPHLHLNANAPVRPHGTRVPVQWLAVDGHVATFLLNEFLNPRGCSKSVQTTYKQI